MADLSPEQREEVAILLQDTAAMLRGMTMDPAIPDHAKAAMRGRIVTLESWAETVAP